MNSLTQVIAAVSTPPGKGGVAIIRMSGDGALEIAEKAFFALSVYTAHLSVKRHLAQKCAIACVTL